MPYIIVLILLLSLSKPTPCRTISVSAEVSNSGYSLNINEVHEIQNELFILATITPPPPNMITLAVISTVTDTVSVVSLAVTENIFIISPAKRYKTSDKTTFIPNKKIFNNVLLEASKLKINQEIGDSNAK